MNFIKKYWFTFSIVISLVLGSIIGVIASDKTIEHIKPFGDLFINLMFTLVVPLVFFTITSSIASLSRKLKLSSILLKTILVFFITSIVSAVFMTGIMLFFNPSNGTILLENSTTEASSNVLSKIVSAISVNDFYNLLSKSNMLALIIFSLLFGISLRSVDKENKISSILTVISNSLLKCVKIIMYYAPIGICAYFATLINSFGNELITSYTKALIIYLIATVLYFLIFYTLYAYIGKGKKGVKLFYKNILPSFTTSLATQSSLATLPTNLETSKRMEIDSNISSISLPLASTIHMEGSVIASILKIFFLFAIFNMTDLSLSSYLIAIFIAVFSGVVMSGVPGGGLIGEMLIVSLYGFPLSAFTIIATIGWLIDAPATMLNVCGDLPSSMMIEKLSTKKAK
jgi:Na+/H+-dicarboxylate symporter